ncbi:type II secretion system major pseudopilin GspG [Marinobacter lutaoensis]|uniref:Type II secretion system core protein G n=2 Tax=Marinobacter lutaoensis TaxID=135739 RepID=A0A1V2DTR0_9GAMM|nr:type II secretion system major pseudopilin GspG [Marinobacter lutaoensis]MBE02141.1 type II secretion system protein GspG [Marinobacter sp.]MBI42417.1 type II secretion system protein GspG [Oceanospirillales bacterium]NVD35533.1 type II secretion system major pseudopilin GspG [Marinobacter lutaoensis]ONF44068.1 type II secretion system protein GspG [Marinobacter lutaoensis]
MTTDTKMNATSRRQPETQRGFTLIEIMVVMVILGLLVAIVAPNIMGRSDQAKVTIAQTQLKNIQSALDLYRLDNSHYPSTQQGLEALVSKPSGTPEPRNWNPDGYLKSVPEDPWGTPYQYVSPGTEGPYDLYSLGSDGQEGGDGDAADISVWDVKG